ncbi:MULTISPECIES: hypothetical protein [unclassified Streptomyces]|uniref:hypothetical protein n=1 Tax=unclassified Streptomyces TaxID=2593676 RepID=UPI0035DD08BF
MEADLSGDRRHWLRCSPAACPRTRRSATTTGIFQQDGKHLREVQGISHGWRVATDGKALYGVRKPEAADKALAAWCPCP